MNFDDQPWTTEHTDVLCVPFLSPRGHTHAVHLAQILDHRASGCRGHLPALHHPGYQADVALHTDAQAAQGTPCFSLAYFPIFFVICMANDRVALYSRRSSSVWGGGVGVWVDGYAVLVCFQ